MKCGKEETPRLNELNYHGNYRLGNSPHLAGEVRISRGPCSLLWLCLKLLEVIGYVLCLILVGTRYGTVRLRRVPKGFPVLLKSFAREVLREQPSDVSKFGVDYFKALLDRRNSTGEHTLKTDPLDEPGFHTTPKKALRPVRFEVGQKEIQQEIAAAKIQAVYRVYSVRKQSRQQCHQTNELQHETAATKIQAQYRGYRTRRSLKTVHEKIPETESPEVEKGQEQLQFSEDENNAALRIQANFRGYQARKSLKPDENEEDSAAVTEAPEDNDEEMTAASVKIQASYGGHRTRKHLKETRNASLIVEEARLSVDDKEENEISDERLGEADAIPDKEQGKSDMDGNVETSQETGNTENEKESRLHDPEIKVAVLIIQASYRRYRTMMELKENMKESPREEPKASGGGDADASETKLDLLKESRLHDPKIQVAVLKIQEYYRRYQTMMQLKEDMKVPESPRDKRKASGGGDADASETKPDLLSEPEQHVEQSLEAPEESNAAAGDTAAVPEKEENREEAAAIKFRAQKLQKSNEGSVETPVTVADIQEEKQDNAEPED